MGPGERENEPPDARDVRGENDGPEHVRAENDGPEHVRAENNGPEHVRAENDGPDEHPRDGPDGPVGHNRSDGLTGQAVVGLLATTQRLRVVAAVVLGAATPAEIATAAGLTEAQVSTALNRLVRGRLVGVVDGRFEVDPQVFADAARHGASRREPVDYGVNDPKLAAVLRAFLVDGRLVRIPARGRKRTAVFEYLATTFEPGQRYTEREVNAILASFHPDTAALRRYLVDEGFLSRAGGVYWRTGGWVDVL